ncbi:MAG: hypothetical protein MR630_06435, partial [Selenomonas sp.]|uniref:hypothetical protein n=1 Tax=Selenomonas sp. TaxID=2053611 RepID=UPI0025F55B58
GTVSEEFACPLDDRSTRAEVCMNEVFYPLHADFSRHAGCFPCAKFEIIPFFSSSWIVWKTSTCWNIMRSIEKSWHIGMLDRCSMSFLTKCS